MIADPYPAPQVAQAVQIPNPHIIAAGQHATGHEKAALLVRIGVELVGGNRVTGQVRRDEQGSHPRGRRRGAPPLESDVARDSARAGGHRRPRDRRRRRARGRILGRRGFGRRRVADRNDVWIVAGVIAEITGDDQEVQASPSPYSWADSDRVPAASLQIIAVSGCLLPVPAAHAKIPGLWIIVADLQAKRLVGIIDAPATPPQGILSRIGNIHVKGYIVVFRRA